MRKSSWINQYKRTDFDGLDSLLLDFDFSPLLQSSDIEHAWSFLKDAVLTSFSLYTLIVKISCLVHSEYPLSIQ